MELTEKQDLFQIIFDSTANGISVIQPVYNDQGEIKDFSILFLNAYALKQINDLEYKGRLYTEVFPGIKDNGILEKFIHTASTGIASDFESRYTINSLKYWFRFALVKQGELLILTTENLTKRKKTEIALKSALETAEKQTRFYHSITSTTPDLVYVFDLSYKFTYANKALLTMWGKSAEEAIGKGLRDNGYEEWHAKMHEREMDEVVSSKKRIRGTVSFPHAELGIRIYDYIFAPVFNEEGEVEAIAGTTRDITEIKQAEEQQFLATKKIEESENRFRVLVNALSDVVFRMNADWTVMRNLDGIDLLSDEGDVVFNWIDKFIYIEDQEKALSLIAAAIANKKIFEMEHRALKSDGTLGWTFSRAIPILDDQNNIIEWFGAAGDISSQKEVQRIIKDSEEKFRQLADLVPQVIWTAKPDGYVDYFNKRWYEYTGLDQEKFGDESWVPMLHRDDVLPVLDAWYISVQEGISYQLEFRLENKNTGQYRWFLSKAVPIRDKTGVIVRWFGTCTDIHEQKTITEKLESLVADRTKELKRSNEDLQQFAHVASHDLKEPVRKIKTFTSRLEEHLEGKLDEASSRFIGRIHVAADRMFNMIDGVLMYSKINANLQKATLVDLNDVLKNIETDLEVSLQNTKGEIHCNDLPKLEGALVLLYQLFYNLINNSIKFTKNGVAPKITISSKTIMENQKIIALITVEDNGIGFENEQAAQIFETFTRLNSKDVYEGTGLGLSLCKKIVERHGGSISAVGRPYVGAVFTIKLPLRQQENGI